MSPKQSRREAKMKRNNIVAAVLVLVLAFAFQAVAQDTGPATSNRIAFSRWVRTGSFTFTNKTLTSPTITGPTFSGTSTFGGVINVGADDTGYDVTFYGATASNYLLWDESLNRLDVYSTSASTDGGTSVQPIYMYSVMTGDAGVGGRACFHLYTEADLGGWANALKGYFDIGASGSVSGLGSAIVAEMRFPGEAVSTGSYGVLEIELVTQASGTFSSPVAMQWMQVSGDATATASWEDSGYIWIIKGLTDDTGNIFDSDTNPTCDATLRILIGDTPYYILLSDSPTS